MDKLSQSFSCLRQLDDALPERDADLKAVLCHRMQLSAHYGTFCQLVRLELGRPGDCGSSTRVPFRDPIAATIDAVDMHMQLSPISDGRLQDDLDQLVTELVQLKERTLLGHAPSDTMSPGIPTGLARMPGASAIPY